MDYWNAPGHFGPWAGGYFGGFGGGNLLKTLLVGSALGAGLGLGAGLLGDLFDDDGGGGWDDGGGYPHVSAEASADPAKQEATAISIQIVGLAGGASAPSGSVSSGPANHAEPHHAACTADEQHARQLVVIVIHAVRAIESCRKPDDVAGSELPRAGCLAHGCCCQHRHGRSDCCPSRRAPRRRGAGNHQPR